MFATDEIRKFMAEMRHDEKMILNGARERLQLAGMRGDDIGLPDNLPQAGGTKESDLDPVARSALASAVKVRASRSGTSRSRKGSRAANVATDAKADESDDDEEDGS